MSHHGCPERLRSKGFQEDGQSQPSMELLVETLTGTAFEMTVSPSDTIFAIKSKIFRVEGIPVSQQHLLYNLKELEDSSSLHDHSITDGARLRLVLGMCGGPVTTRRLPPPPSAEPWRDIERLLDTTRSEGEWGGACKVTVVVFRDGERVNMLRVRNNRDGTYSPLDHAKCRLSTSTTTSPPSPAAGARADSARLRDNARTMRKVADLRARLASLALGRRTGIKSDIQKTRSEETLSVPSLLDDTAVDPFKSTYTPFGEPEDSFSPHYDGNYTRYEYDCSFADRYSLLPPIGTRTDSEPSVQEAGDSDLLSGLTGSILVKGDDEAAILEECLDGVDDCRDSPQLAAKNMAPIPATEYGPVSGVWWRGAGRLPPLQHSASTLQLRARPPPRALHASTPDLQQHRILPALSRHRNREHLHLSDEGLAAPPPPPEPKPAAVVDTPAEGGGRARCAVCRRRLSVATLHECGCGGRYCAPHRYQEAHACTRPHRRL